MSLVARLVQITDPQRIHIPAGWFSMGSDSGQDVEAPVHRVWVDSFDIAATQVTVDEYARFLDATGRTAPTFWGDPSFSLILCNLWWRFPGTTRLHIARGFPR